MTRTISASAETASLSDVVRPIIMADLDFEGGRVYLTSAVFNFDWNGHTWVGIGDLGAVDTVREGTTAQADAVSLTLTGIPSDYISETLNYVDNGRTAKIYLALLDSDHHIIADPVLAFQGRLDEVNIELGDQASVTITCQNRLVDWETPRDRRYNDADQQQEYPGDLGFQYVEQTVTAVVNWGGDPHAPPDETYQQMMDRELADQSAHNDADVNGSWNTGDGGNGGDASGGSGAGDSGSGADNGSSGDASGGEGMG